MMILTGDAKVVAAFVKARGQIEATVKKDARGNYGKYATLAALTEATATAMAENGCAIVQEISVDDRGATVNTWVLHESGGTIQFDSLTLPVTQHNAQAVGSASTYARRYQLAAICGIAPDDDDAQAAVSGGQSQQRPPQQAQKSTGKSKPGNNAPPAEPEQDFGMGEPPQDDGQQPDVTEGTLKRLHALGSQVYGKEWDAKRHELVMAVSKGATDSSKNLMEAEAVKLCAGLDAKLAQMQQPDAKQKVAA